jgi:hypothetical protein
MEVGDQHSSCADDLAATRAGIADGEDVVIDMAGVALTDATKLRATDRVQRLFGLALVVRTPSRPVGARLGRSSLMT